MKFFNFIKPYSDWLESKWEQGNTLVKVILFFLAPQIIASVYTGISLRQLWRKQGIDDTDFRRHFFRNITIWTLAVLWFYSFWLVIFPTLVHFAL